jgi:hypothetical protein
MGREREMARIDLLSSIHGIRVHSRPALLPQESFEFMAEGEADEALVELGGD